MKKLLQSNETLNILCVNYTIHYIWYATILSHRKCDKSVNPQKSWAYRIDPPNFCPEYKYGKSPGTGHNPLHGHIPVGLTDDLTAT